jgi:hypothetical protein
MSIIDELMGGTLKSIVQEDGTEKIEHLGLLAQLNN